MKLKVWVFFVLLFGIAFSVQAQANRRNLPKAQCHQRHEIHRGMRNGSISPREGARLSLEQRKIHRQSQMAKADGVVTPNERHHLNRSLRNSQRHIRRERRD